MQATAATIRAAAAAITLALASAPLAADVRDFIYCDDFATRTSGNPTPSDKWLGYDYTPNAHLAYSYATGSYVYAPDMPWRNPAAMQDGWIGGGYGTWTPVFCITNNLAEELPGDTDKPFGAFRLNTSSVFSGTFYHPIGNSFTNGTLKFWVDMRAPRLWGSQNVNSRPRIRFFPAFRSYLRNPDPQSNPVTYPMVCGLQAEGNYTPATSVRFMGYSDTSSGTGSLKGMFGDAGAIDTGCWYRYYMQLNLDTKRIQGSVRKLGTTVPAWDAEGTDIKGFGSTGNYYLYRHPTAETGPIEGIGFEAVGVTDRGVVTNMACVTNIRISWVPPGETEDIPCYSNNFTTCWRRSVTPAATSFAATPVASHDGTDVFTGYEIVASGTFPTAEGKLFPNSGGNKAQVEPIGRDGWRRINAAGICNVSIVDSTGDAGPVMRISRSSSDGRFVGAAQTLGESITSGKVRICVDACPPDAWDWSSARGIYAALGNATLYNGAVTSPSDMIALSSCAQTGLSSASDTAKPYPVYYTSAGQQKVTTTNVAFRTWCRFIITADMDAKTYDWAVYDLGNGASGKPAAFPTPALPIASGAGVQFRNNISEISTFVLWGYAPKYNNWNGAILFDNIQVWKNWDGSAGDLIYYNDFSERRRAVTTDAWDLADANNIAAPEKDFWTRRGGTFGVVKVSSGANPCAVFNDFAPAVAVHELGTPVIPSHGRKYELRADMRPPTKWYGSGAYASVLWGGDDFAQGDTFGGADILSRAAIRVGFKASGSADVCGRYSSSTICMTNGGNLDNPSIAITSSDWYRFVVKTTTSPDTYSVKIYNQGTTQPEPSDADGVLVGTYEGLSLATGSSSELTTVGIAATRLGAVSPWLADDPDRALIDNLSVVKVPSALIMVVK